MKEHVAVPGLDLASKDLDAFNAVLSVMGMLTAIKECNSVVKSLESGIIAAESVQGADAQPEAPETSEAPLLSPLERAKALLQPGVVLEGTIAIPGTDSEGDLTNEYTLQVLEEKDGELLALHSAYTDQQVVTLHLAPAKDSSTTVRLEYYDAETFCTGALDLATHAVTGIVQQLVNGDEGFFYPTDAAIHTFHLKRTPQTSERREMVARLWTERTRLVNLIHALLEKKATEAHTLVKQMAICTSNDALCAQLRELAGHDCQAPCDYATLQGAIQATELLVDWGTLVMHAGLLAERQCCELRHLQSRMQQMRFDAEEDKDRMLSTLPSRESVHRLVDQVFKVVHDLVWQGPHSAAPSAAHSTLPLLFYKASIRLPSAYKRFDTTLRGAERRLPMAVVRAHCQRPAAPDGPAAACTICQLPLAQDEECTSSDSEALVLECGHAFHAECLFQWLHAEVSCPNCRWQLPVSPAKARPKL